jgi:DNA repair protein RadA/Sms
VAAASIGSVFVCGECQHQTRKWFGRCPECGTWDGLVERRDDKASRRTTVALGLRSAQRYPEIEAARTPRSSTGIGELDRVLGGGLVSGAAILIGGEPGIGKSTLLLQAASARADQGQRVLYVSGEESLAQLRSRGDRLGVSSASLLVAAETDVDRILQIAAESDPTWVVIDSIQSVRCAGLDSIPGSVSQVREAASRFVAWAKTSAVPVLLVGHVTKDGSLAGPRVLEHVVDTVVQFEGDRHHDHRLLRARKNRYGPTDEIGVFAMTESGLVEVEDPSELLLAERAEDAPGSAVLAAVEGTRPLLVEIQALAGDPIQGSPRRTALGIDAQRVALILAVLHRRIGLELANRDVFVNVTGGINILEPAADLAVAMAIVSSAIERPLPPLLALAGEIGLTGEIRSVSRMDSRLREAVRLGFTSAVTPASGLPGSPPDGLRLHPARHLNDALRGCFGAETIKARQIG